VSTDPRRARLDAARAELIAVEVETRALLELVLDYLKTHVGDDDPIADWVTRRAQALNDRRAVAAMEVRELGREMGLDTGD
jgi:hypothetical protein